MECKRNSICWCGSNDKYKRCHEKFDRMYQQLKLQGKIMPHKTLVKNKQDIMGIKRSAKINNGVLDYVEKHIRIGMTTEEIDQLVYEYTKSHGAICAPYQYHGFPKHCCTSINNVVCHGIPSEKDVLKDGDIINVDVSTIFHGYYSDASRMFMIGEVSEEAKHLVEITKECMKLGIEAIHPWGHVGDIGAAIVAHASKHGYSVVRDFAGHGVGKEFHEDPVVSHVATKNTGMILVPGMVLTVEPMINAGKWQLYIDSNNGWSAYTKDGSLSAQWENMILVTEDGIEILSE